ncbi:hypothetical protein B0H19DRAFT_1066971 [Mycena capillaripes]|nr:hypothetical protein B0H19DRAFT_1066971 [Mycena capillaripes]
MAPGRLRLDPDIKHQHVQQSRRRYEDKQRGAIANSDVFTKRNYAKKAAKAAGRYRFRKSEMERAEQRATDAARKRTRVSEAQAVRKKHKDTAKPPRPSSIAKPSAVAKPRDCARRCPHCYTEECIGCACMCPDSDEWFEHADGHFFPTCKMCGQECPSLFPSPMSPGSPCLGTLLCEPEYIPDAGHEDRWSHPGPFYAVVSTEWQGSSASLDRMLTRYPYARTWEATPWSTFHRMWNLDCMEYHNHGGHAPAFVPITPESSVPSSPSSLTDSTTSCHPSPLPPKPPFAATLPSPFSAPHTAASSPPASPRKSPGTLTKDELAFLASFKPGPGPISPQRLNQQFARVLGPHAVAPSSFPRVREDSSPTGVEAPPETLCIAPETIAATLRAGGRL